jgi:hypothetical protein
MLIPVSVTLNLLASMRVSPLHFALLASVACSDTSGLPDPTFNNEERTETLYALTGTPVGTPSAYAIHGSRRVRTDESQDFDFAYNVEADDRPVFVPRAVLGIDPNTSVQPGLQPTSLSFEGMIEAPTNGYITEQVVPIAIGDRFFVRSRIGPNICAIGVPKYAKLEVVSIDAATRSVTFRVLTNNNCGYRGLQPGLPDV